MGQITRFLADVFRTRPPAYAPGDRIRVGACPVLLRVDRRARRVSLRLDPTRREMIATAPSARRLPEAAAFAAERAGWMADLMERLPEGRRLAPGDLIEVLGRSCRLERVPGRSGPGVVEDGGDLALRVCGEGMAFERAAIRALKAHALTMLRERTLAHAAALGAAAPEVKLTDARTRWGSCKPPRGARIGVIRYSWRLVMAPFGVMDYVAAHEAAHLIRADHSPAFWAEVKKLVLDEKAPRVWLRAHGAMLHAVGR